MSRLIDWFRRGEIAEPFDAEELLPRKVPYPCEESVDKARRELQEQIDAIPLYGTTTTCAKCGSDMIDRTYSNVEMSRIIRWNPDVEEKPVFNGWNPPWTDVRESVDLMKLLCISCGYKPKAERCLDYSRD